MAGLYKDRGDKNKGDSQWMYLLIFITRTERNLSKSIENITSLTTKKDCSFLAATMSSTLKTVCTLFPFPDGGKITKKLKGILLLY